MTHDEMLEVIAAHKAGNVVQFRDKRFGGIWGDASPPAWDFHNYDYRIKPREPRDFYVKVCDLADVGPIKAIASMRGDNFPPNGFGEVIHVREVL
jgi:hypothetical protein